MPFDFFFGCAGKGTLLGMQKAEVFGNQRHGIRYLAAAQGLSIERYEGASVHSIVQGARSPLTITMPC